MARRQRQQTNATRTHAEGNRSRRFFDLLRKQLAGQAIEDLAKWVGVGLLTVGAFLLTQIDWKGLFHHVRPQTIVLQEDAYHIGDVEFKAVIGAGGQVSQTIPYDHPAPEANPFRSEFVLDGTPRQATLHLTARDVDPDEVSSPVEIRLNDQFVEYLNRKFTRETMEGQAVSIAVQPALFKEGTNVLLIYGQPTRLEYGNLNLHDFEFWNVVLELK